MKITTFYEQGSPGMEVSLGVDHGQALVEAVDQRVKSLCDQGRYDELTAQDNEIIDRSPGAGIELRILEPDSVIRDLDDFHATTFTAISAIIDGRHNSRRSKWKIDARERLRLGRTALSMADTFRTLQADQDRDIIDGIESLGVYKGHSSDELFPRKTSPPCRSTSESRLAICGLTGRPQRRLRHLHG